MSVLVFPTPITEIIKKLSIIALIEKDKKLNLKTMSFSQSNTWGTMFYRTLYGESRIKLLEFLNSTINETIQNIFDYRSTEFCRIVVNHLNLARGGIENLTKTYENDANIISQLNIILENIDIQLAKNKKLIMKNFNPLEEIEKLNQFPIDN